LENACKTIAFVDTLVLMMLSVYYFNSPYSTIAALCALAMMFLMSLHSLYSQTPTTLRPFQLLLAS